MHRVQGQCRCARAAGCLRRDGPGSVIEPERNLAIVVPAGNGGLQMDAGGIALHLRCDDQAGAAVII